MVKLPSIIVLVIYAVLVESSEWKMLEKSNDTLELVHVVSNYFCSLNLLQLCNFSYSGTVIELQT